MNYENYHKHTHRSNIFSPDTHTRPEEYCKRAKELGHKAYFTTEHGYGGDIFEAKELCLKYELKCIFAMEGYIVENPEEKDNRNYHILLIARTNIGRRKLNKINSLANRNGYYYKPRLFINDLLKISPDDVYITTACIAGFIRDDDSINNIFLPLLKHFRSSLFLEIQSHSHPKQILHNEKILELYEKYGEEYGISIVSANDSHYIYPEDNEKRESLLSGKKIKYDDENSFILDYPDIDTVTERYIAQGVLSKDLIDLALNNTLLFSECDEIDINFLPKMPTLYKNKTEDEKFNILRELAYSNFEKIKIEDGIKDEDIPKYHKEIEDCLSVVNETSEMHTADYFLIDHQIVKTAIEKYGGILTRSGRGSCGAFYLNRTMGLTQLDRFTTTIPIYPDRFMSTARTLENHSYPDIDLNVVSQEPFILSSKDYLGELGCLPMVAYGTMQISESFRNICRSMGMEFAEFNDVAKNLEAHTKDKKWGNIISKAELLSGTIVSASIHPCSYLLFDGDIEEEIGIVKLGENYCTTITSDEADTWKYLKND